MNNKNTIFIKIVAIKKHNGIFVIKTKMNKQEFYSELVKNAPFELTYRQDSFLQKIAGFLTNNISDEIFVLQGYAGTGKTTLLSLVVNHLQLISKKSVMLAPTGRAAKVIANYSQLPAYTIHKRIYFPQKSGGFKLQPNKFKNTIFIVDEASMISDVSTDTSLYPNGSLLDDLIHYVYTGENCKLILIGDTAQLPPVGMDESPALQPDYLRLNFPVEVGTMELNEVVRQEEDSGILYNATELRSLIEEDFFEFFQFEVNHFKDIQRLIAGDDILDAIHDAYSKKGVEDTIFIVRSNKRANLYNQQIRYRILDRESELSAGDLVMVVKNNYFWLKESKITDFIANGDVLEILRIYKNIELYGFRFASVLVRMIDYPDLEPFETIVLLDTLTADAPALTYEQNNKLYEEVAKDYEDESTAYKKMQKIKNNEYFNALQIKFAYAITCHKAQGGQWDTVFVEQPYLPEGLTKDAVKWIYTALTRAQRKAYLIGFDKQYFEE